MRSGELRNLSAERVWQELARGFIAAQPLRMLEVLQLTKAAAELLASGTKQRLKDDQAKKTLAIELNLITSSEDKIADVCAVILSNLSATEITQWAEQVRMPNRIRDYAILFSALRTLILVEPTNALDVIAWFNRADVWRNPLRADALLHLLQQLSYQAETLILSLHAAQAVDAAQIAQLNTPSATTRQQSSPTQPIAGEKIRLAIEAARLKAIEPYCSKKN